MNLLAQNVEIVPSDPGDADILTAIAISAKRHWGYPESWIEDWRDALTITPEFVAERETYSVLTYGKIVAFCGLCRRDSSLWLEHLWVKPEAHRRGIGRALFSHAVARCITLGFQSLGIEADPNAEGFYLRMGARRIGARPAKHGHELPILRYVITNVTVHQ